MAQIVWFANEHELVVQFKDIGEYSYFTVVLNQFKAIGKVHWSYEKQSWKLSLEDFPKVVRFADQRNIRLVWVGHDTKPTQLSLF